MTNLIALPGGTELVGDYRIGRVLGAGGFGVTYLADEIALSRAVTIKEYFPSDFAARTGGLTASPRSEDCQKDYTWGLERFIDEAQTLARFNHAHIVKVYRYFRANNTAYMVLHFEEGQNFKTWLKSLGRAPRQKELDAILSPLLDALETIHKADFLHRDLAPDNIIIRNSGEPVLIDFGAARSDIAAHSKTKTVSALVKPGYSPYEQYSETSRQQGPWTDIYALAATLYHAICGKRPPDSPSRMMTDDYVPARHAALSSYRGTFLDAIDKALALRVDARPQTVAEWRGALLAPEPRKPGVMGRMREKTAGKKAATQMAATEKLALTAVVPGATVPPPPDAPAPVGQLLDFVEQLKPGAPPAPAKKPKSKLFSRSKPPRGEQRPAAIAPAPPAGKARAVSPPVSLSPPVSPSPKARSKAPPVPAVVRRRAWTEGLKTKVILAAGFAGALLAFQDQLPRLIAGQPGTSITTGAIGAASSSPAISQKSSFQAHQQGVERIAYSGDGRLIVTSGADQTRRTFDAETGTLKSVTAMEHGAAQSLAVRGDRALTTHADGTAVLSNLADGRTLASFKRNEATAWAGAFIGSDDRVAVAAHDWTIALWNSTSTAAPEAILNGHDNAVQALAADPSGRWLVSGGADRSVKLWNLDSRTLKRSYRNDQDFVSALALGADGDMIAAGSLDGSVRLWLSSSTRSLRTFRGHRSKVTALAISPGGDLLASAAEDGTVRVRGLRRSKADLSLDGRSEGGTTLAFAPDGRTLAIGGADGRVSLWTLPEPRIAQR